MFRSHLTKAFNDEWDEFICYACEWLVNDDEHILLRPGPLEEELEEEELPLPTGKTRHRLPCDCATDDDRFVLLLPDICIPVRKLSESIAGYVRDYE